MRRLKEHRARLAVRAWEYRQRHHAKGTWMRLRRALAAAAEAFVVPEDECEELLKEGFRALPVGKELEPSKTILFVTRERARAIVKKAPLALSLGPELMEARALILIPFNEDEALVKNGATEQTR
jgi:hypothetical protein